jgi:polyisoprenoid-binding protein YceI
MKKIIITTLITGIFALSNAQRYESEIKFYIDNVGSTVEGSFSGFEADIDFNPDKPEDSRIEASVEVSTINTGIELRNNHLQAKKFFWEEKYPEIKMESDDIIKTGEGNFRGDFDLTIKGTTRTLEIPFKHTKLGNTEQFRGEFTIDRTDFDVGNKALLYDEKLRVEIEVKVIN